MDKVYPGVGEKRRKFLFRGKPGRQFGENNLANDQFPLGYMAV